MKQRLVNYDLIRVLACIFVIMIHIETKPFSFPVRVAYTTVFFLSNGIFYMLSGRFNLEQTFDQVGDYLNYYRKKCISILFPFILVSFLLSIFNYYHTEGSIALKSVCIFAFREFFALNSDKALWFMYPLIGFIVSAPFLSKMFHAMSDRECMFMVAVAMIWNCVKVYLTTDFGVEFKFSGWLLETWILYFTAGYLVSRLINEKNRKAVYLLGFAGYIITVILRLVPSEQLAYLCDYSPAFFLFCIAAYDLAVRKFTIRNPYACRLISWIAQHTFLIYLLHVHVMRYLVPYIAVPDTSSVPGYLLKSALIFICSLICAVLLRALIIRPLQSLLKKLPGLRLTQQENKTT